uniref:Uncharacterized protein n=1 Tax=Anguilla anguilla TaxID=7936 RepID=A0A0E9XMR3_ANGAN
MNTGKCWKRLCIRMRF